MTTFPTNYFEITSSLRYDNKLLRSEPNTTLFTEDCNPSPFYMLRYHQDRMLVSMSAFGMDTNRLEGREGLKYLENSLLEHVESESGGDIHLEPLKIRITTAGAQITSTTSSTVPDCSLASLFPSSLFSIKDPSIYDPALYWRVYIGFADTIPGLFTRHKTTNREIYNKACGMLHSMTHDDSIAPCPKTEILIVNTDGEIMEGSITTPYFLRNSEWVTPAAKCGGNLGTTRRWALEYGLCKEGIVDSRYDVHSGDIIVLSNGVRGFEAGLVVDLLQKSK